MSTATTASSLERPVIRWWPVLLQGIALLVLGVLFVLEPGMTSLIVITLLGLYWLIAGVVRIASIFVDSTSWGWKLLIGVLGIIAGIIVLRHPIVSGLLVGGTLIIMLGILSIIIGAITLYMAFKGGGWATGVLGAVGILIGILLLFNAFGLVFSLPFWLGILCIVGGILSIWGAFGLKKLDDQLEEAARQAVRSAARAGDAVSDAAIDSGVAVTGAAAAGAGAVAGAGQRAVDVAGDVVEDAGEAVGDVADAAAAGAGAAVGAAAGAGQSAVDAAGDVVEDAGEAVGDVADAAVAGAGAAVDAAAGVGERAVDAAGDVVEDAGEAVGDAARVATDRAAGTVGETGRSALTSALEYVEGIGPVYASQLEEIGIRTPQELLDKGATPKGRIEIAEKSGISRRLILEWVNHVDLYRIKGVGSEYADLLEAAGVDTVVELAQRNAENLYNKLVQVNEEKRLVRELPSAAQVQDWVRQAKDLPRVIQY